VDYVLAFGGVEVGDSFEELKGFGEVVLCLLRIGLFEDADFFGRKKLLRFGAGFSTRAVVVPVDFL
jgi:hypothetical protein